MEKAGLEGADQSPPLPPPAVVPPKLQPELVDLPKRSIISRRGVGNCGRSITLLTNHFKVSVNASDAIFYQYTVCLSLSFFFLELRCISFCNLLLTYHLQITISAEDGKITESKSFGRRLLDRLYQTYSSELAGKKFAYDGEKSLYTVGPLPQNKFEFTVILEESRAKRYVYLPFSSKFWIQSF